MSNDRMKRIIRKHILSELYGSKDVLAALRGQTKSGTSPTVPGSFSTDAEFDITKLVTLLGYKDSSRVKTAIMNMRSGKRTTMDNAVLADLFSRVIDALSSGSVSRSSLLTLLSSIKAPKKSSANAPGLEELY